MNSGKIQLRTDLFPELKGIDDEVEKALQDKQKGRQYKDAGKRVHGSRKEQAMYDKLIRSSDLDSIEEDEATAIELIKKNKVFPKVDTQFEKENGTNSGCAFLKTKIRAAFPQKPYNNTKEAREQYVKMAEEFVRIFKDAINLDDLRALFTLATDGSIIPNTDFGMLFGKTLRNIIFALKGYLNNVGTARKTLNEALRYDGVEKDIAEGNLECLLSDYHRRIDRQQKCIDLAKQIISQADMRYHKANDLTFRGGMLRSQNTIEGYVKYVTSVCTRFINEDTAKIEQQKQQYPYKECPPDWSWTDTKKRTSSSPQSSKSQINNLPLAYIKRTGGLLIENVDEHTVIKQLHFKSLTLGNYVKDDEAREHIRHFVGGIVDLCEVLDLNLEINECLAIAFGAFGRGGKAMATYYPIRQLINLTKRNGDGSVAHEWGHYFDHYLNDFETKDRRMLRSKYYLNIIFERLGYHKKYFIGTSNRTLTKDWFKSLLKECIDADIPNNIFHKSIAQLIVMLRFGYYELNDEAISYNESGETDKRRTDSYLFHYSKLQGSYWASIEEMFARSFECYVFDKLKGKNRVNNYLVSGDNFSYPVYPQGQERIYINKCFDNLMYAIKEHLKIKSFEPFTSKRADEYIDLKENGAVNKGVIVSKKKKLQLAKIKTKAIRIKQQQLKIS